MVCLFPSASFSKKKIGQDLDKSELGGDVCLGDVQLLFFTGWFTKDHFL